jgi:uncharacterized ferredoxin-like protein
MAILEGFEATNDALLSVAKAGAMAAMTVQTVAGTNVKAKILTGEDVLPLVEILEILGESHTFIRPDAAVVRKAYEAGVYLVELLLFADGTVSDLGWNCGACGFNSCEEFNRYSKKNKSQGAMAVGPNCNWKVVDFGIASSAAAAAISAENVECRVKATYYMAASALGHLEDCNLGIGITVGPVKDSAWFNRVDLKDSFTLEEHEQFVKNTLPQLYVGFCGQGNPLLKHRPDWAAEPKFWRESEDKELLAKREDEMARVGQIVEREMKKRGSSKENS